MQASLVSSLRRYRRLLLWIAGLFVAYILAGFLLAPVIVKQQLVKHASAALHRNVAIGQVRVNPLALSLTIRGLSVTDRDGTELAGWDEFYANFQASSLFRWSVQLASLSSRERAIELQQRLRAQGYNAYVRSVDGMNRVFVGPVIERAEANRLRDQLNRQQKLNGFIVRFQPEQG